MVINQNNTDPYIKRSELALLGDNPIAVTNKATGGSIGTAATTVDIASSLNVNQTTAGQTLTLPNPTVTGLSHLIVVNNVGSVSFTVLSTVLAPGAGILVDWTGSAWSVTGTSSGASNVVVIGGKTFTVNNTLTLAGTDGTTMTFPSTSATIARTDAANTFTGVQTMTSPVISGHATIEGVTPTGATGTGLMVFGTSPTFITPTLGVATATSYNGMTLTSSTGTFTLANSKTFVVNNGITLTGTDSTVMTFPTTTATIARTDAAQTFTGVQTFSTHIVLEGVTSTGATGTGNFVFSASPTFSGTATFTHIIVEGVTSTGATGTGSVVFATTPTLVTPVLGVATGTSLAVTGAITSSGTAGIGYATGAGGTVTQITNRTTGVTLNKISGTITTASSSLAAESAAAFVVTNTLVAITDVVVLSFQSGTNGGNTTATVTVTTNGSFTINVANQNASGGTAETGAILINFVVIKSVAA